MAKVIEVNCLDELNDYRLLWNALFAGTPNASFFLTLDWLDAYWRHFGYDQKLKVLIAYAAGEPLGILPLCVRTEKHGLNNVRVLTYPLDNWGTWYGPIGPNPAATMLAAVQHLRTTPRDWDMIELRWVADDATQGGKTARALRIAGMLSDKREHQTTSVIELPKDWDAFVASKSGAMGDHSGQLLRQAFEKKRAEYIRHRPKALREGGGDPRWDLYATCEQIAAASRTPSGSRCNTSCQGGLRNFDRDAHTAAARLGMLDVNLLVFDSIPAAFLYGYHCHGRVTVLHTGYNPSLGDDGIGSALMLRAIQDSIARGDHFIDLGPGEHEHTRSLRTRTESTYRLTYTPLGSWRSQTVRWTRWAKNRWPRRVPAVPRDAAS